MKKGKILLVLGLLILFLTINNASGEGSVVSPPENPPTQNLQTTDLPGLIEGGERKDFTDFLLWLYPFMLSLAAFLAVLMIVISGIQWIGSMGSVEAVKNAKARFFNAILGLILAFTAWLILNAINPDLVKFKLFNEEVNGTNTVSICGLEGQTITKTTTCKEEGRGTKTMTTACNEEAKTITMTTGCINEKRTTTMTTTCGIETEGKTITTTTTCGLNEEGKIITKQDVCETEGKTITTTTTCGTEGRTTTTTITKKK